MRLGKRQRISPRQTMRGQDTNTRVRPGSALADTSPPPSLAALAATREGTGSRRANMADVLINHPYFGSMWLSNCYIEDGLVVGDFWDDSDVGDWALPDDYNGEWQTFNFPVSCIRKDPDNLRGLPQEVDNA